MAATSTTKLITSADQGNAIAAKEFYLDNYDTFRLDFLITDITGTSITMSVEYYDTAIGAWVALRDSQATPAAIATPAMTADGDRASIVVGPRMSNVVYTTATPFYREAKAVVPRRCRAVFTGTFTVSIVSLQLTRIGSGMAF